MQRLAPTSVAAPAHPTAQSRDHQPVSPASLRIILELKSGHFSPPPGASAAYEKDRLAISGDELAETKRVIEKRIVGYGLPEPTIQIEKTGSTMRSARLIVDIPDKPREAQAYASLRVLLTTAGQLKWLAIPRIYGHDNKRPVTTRAAGRVVFTFIGPGGKEVPTSTVIARSQLLATSRDLEPNAHVISVPGEGTGVSFNLKENAWPAFREFTGEHVGSYIAIVFDDRILACPMIRTAISGEGVIAVDFGEPGGQERAKQLATMINSGPLPLESRYHAVAGETKVALRALDALKEEETYGPSAYLDALEETIANALNARQLETAIELLAGFDAYPICEQGPRTLLRIAQTLRGEGRFEPAAEMLRRGIERDPFSQEAPGSLELLADILGSDLGRTEEAKAARVRLAVGYFPSIPSVAKAVATLGDEMPKTPRRKMILLDTTLMESSTYDRCPTGGCQFGQYEVIKALTEVGYLVHETSNCQELTPNIMDHYGLVVLNGRYGGVAEPPIPAGAIRNLVAYVKGGGNLLVVAGGKALGAGKEPQFYNPLLSRFGLRFAEGAALPSERLAGKVTRDPAVKGIAGFHWEHGVPLLVKQGKILGYAGKQPVIAVAQYGRGRVIAAGLGSGFMGQCLNPFDQEAKQIATDNRALLVGLATYLLGSAQ